VDDRVSSKQRGRDRQAGRFASAGGTDDHGRSDRPAERVTACDAATDQAAADEARLRYRRRGVAPIQPDEFDQRILPTLEPGEALVAMRRSAVVSHTGSVESRAQPGPVDVYVTTRRLLLAGSDVQAFDLASLDQAVVSDERLLLALCDGVGLTLEVDWPRLLRVEIAAARAARR
jgi:hypothetical protein